MHQTDKSRQQFLFICFKLLIEFIEFVSLKDEVAIPRTRELPLQNKHTNINKHFRTTSAEL